MPAASPFDHLSEWIMFLFKPTWTDVLSFAIPFKLFIIKDYTLATMKLLLFQVVLLCVFIELTSETVYKTQMK